MTDQATETEAQPEHEIDRKVMSSTPLYDGGAKKIRIVRLFDMTDFRASKSPYATEECETHAVELVKDEGYETLLSIDSLSSAKVFVDGFVAGWKRRPIP